MDRLGTPGQYSWKYLRQPSKKQKTHCYLPSRYKDAVIIKDMIDNQDYIYKTHEKASVFGSGTWIVTYHNKII